MCTIVVSSPWGSRNNIHHLWSIHYVLVTQHRPNLTFTIIL